MESQDGSGWIAGVMILNSRRGRLLTELRRERRRRSAIIDMVQYERFSDIYAIWTAPAASARANFSFYVDSLWHLLSLGEKRDALRHIHAQLRPGGSFSFDDCS